MIPGSTPMTHARTLAGLSVLALAAPLMPWFVTRSLASEAWTGLVLFAVGVVLLGRPSPTTRTTAMTALFLTVAGAIAHVVGVVVSVRLLQAMGLATLVCGLWPVLRPGQAPSLPALMLVLLGLPLAGDIDVVGFPLRRLSAELAALALPALGVPVAFTETVLMTENGIAEVEAPCAGLSTLRLLVATVAVLAALQRSRAASLAAGIAAAVVVAVLGNATRVTILAWLVLGVQRPDLAALLHVPLGVCVFLAAAAAAVPLLGSRGVSVGAAPPSSSIPTSAPVIAATVGVATLAALVATGLRIDAPAPAPAPHVVAPLPGPVDGEVPLSEAEADLYRRHAIAATKRRLTDAAGRDVGEVLFVVTSGLRAIHAPERCLASNGHAVVTTDAVVRGDVPVKRLVLDGGRAIGLSLLRSGQHDATGLGEVVIARLRGDPGPWVFVSAVVDRAAVFDVAAEDAIVRQLVDDTDALLSASPSGARP